MFNKETKRKKNDVVYQFLLLRNRFTCSYLKINVRFVFRVKVFRQNKHNNGKILVIKYFLSKVGDHSRGWPEGSLFDSLLHQGVGEGATPFPGLLHFTLDPYLIKLSVKQGGIKYHFLSLWYDSTWDWTQVSRAIGEHSKQQNVEEVADEIYTI